MIIKQIVFSNFRNFKNRQEMVFSTESGKLNVIYGLNGEGKTTIHQLFLWLFYGKVNFTKNTEDTVLYNLELAKELNEREDMTVFGQIDFTHENIEYSLVRKERYQKYHNKIEKRDKNLILTYKTKDNLWKPVQKPHQEMIDEMLPEIFSKYFFFDGERMVDELKEGKTKTSTLEKAIFYLFNLQEYSDAIKDLGDVSLPSTVIGKITSELSDLEQENQDLKNAKDKVIKYQKIFENNLKAITDINNSIDAIDEEIQKISEDIGNREGTQKLEGQITNYNKVVNDQEKNLLRCRSLFGNSIYNSYTYLIPIFGSNINESEYQEYFNTDTELIPGLTRTLIEYLIKNDMCLCQRPLTQKERIILENYEKIIPPKSLQSLFFDFLGITKKYSCNIDEILKSIEISENHYTTVYMNIQEYLNTINDIKEQLKESGNVAELVELRDKKTCDKQHLLSQKIDYESNLAIAKRIIESHEGIINKLSKDLKNKTKREKKKDLAIAIRDYLKQQLEISVKGCREHLEENIINLVNYILTSKKIIKVDDNFNLLVNNSHGDSYKNEGTFAVVSFAFVLGLLKTLEIYNDESYDKKYALILDAPFSKLDSIHKSRVIEKLLEYGNQVILFSKDNIHDYLNDFSEGKIYILNSLTGEQTNTNVVKGDKEKINYYFSDEHIAEIEVRKGIL